MFSFLSVEINSEHKLPRSAEYFIPFHYCNYRLSIVLSSVLCLCVQCSFVLKLLYYLTLKINKKELYLLVFEIKALLLVTVPLELVTIQWYFPRCRFCTLLIFRE